MKLRNPILFFLILSFIVVNVIDLITALFVLPGESNPIYILTNSISALFIVKIIVIGFAIYLYRQNLFPSHFIYFGLILFLILGTFMISLGAFSNIYGILNPGLIEEASNIPAKEKVASYFILVSILYIVPVLFSLLSFKLYEISVKRISIRGK